MRLWHRGRDVVRFLTQESLRQCRFLLVAGPDPPIQHNQQSMPIQGTGGRLSALVLVELAGLPFLVDPGRPGRAALAREPYF